MTTVIIDNIAPIAPVISTNSTTTAGTGHTLTGTAESGARVDIYS